MLVVIIVLVVTVYDLVLIIVPVDNLDRLVAILVTVDALNEIVAILVSFSLNHPDVFPFTATIFPFFFSLIFIHPV